MEEISQKRKRNVFVRDEEGRKDGEGAEEESE